MKKTLILLFCILHCALSFNLKANNSNSIDSIATINSINTISIDSIATIDSISTLN